MATAKQMTVQTALFSVPAMLITKLNNVKRASRFILPLL